MTEQKPKARGNGDGSIYQRASDGKYVGQITVGWNDGKQRRRYLTGTTRKEIAEKMKQLLAEQAKGLPITGNKQTVEQYLEDWLTNSVKPSARPRTYASYRQQCRLYIVPALGAIRLNKLTAQQIRAFVNELAQRVVKRSGKPLSPRSVQYSYSILRTALNDALRLDLIPRNPALQIDPPKVERHEAAYLTPEQAALLLNASREGRLYCLYLLAITLGMRCGELLGLRWEDVDFKAARLEVRGSLQRIEGKLIIVDPKTAHSKRSIALSQAAIAALHGHKARLVEERMLAGGDWEEQNLVFPNTEGKPYDAGNMVKIFHHDLVAAGLPRINFHSLRHTCATLLLKQHVDMRVIMDLLGHAQMSTTSDLYSHVLFELQQEAADHMDRLFGTHS